MSQEGEGQFPTPGLCHLMDKETNMKEGLEGNLKNDADIKCLQTQLNAVCSCTQQPGAKIVIPGAFFVLAHSSTCGSRLYQNISMQVPETWPT